VPLRVREQTLGALTCVYGRGGRRYSTEDLPLAQELALRAALAIDNARLYAAERTARAEAEAAVRVREEFLAIAAHELKTPVTSLRGFAELGVRALGVNGTLDATLARRTLETIDRQSARLAALVANLLEVAGDLPTETRSSRARSTWLTWRGSSWRPPGSARSSTRSRCRRLTAWRPSSTRSGSSRCSPTWWTTPSSTARPAA